MLELERHGTSLATALNTISSFLPANQTLTIKDVTGSVREGGRIGWLRWQRGPLSVEATDLQTTWALRSLWDGELRLTRLSIQKPAHRLPHPTPNLRQQRRPPACNCPFWWKYPSPSSVWSGSDQPLCTSPTWLDTMPLIAKNIDWICGKYTFHQVNTASRHNWARKHRWTCLPSCRVPCKPSCLAVTKA
ncbi:MAG: hypothetical protein IPH54_22010 [Rhodoferax sp.]|nr:hypothetical protein [Rhodoferax sp.]